MKTYVLDTHTFLWYVARPRALGKSARRALKEVDLGKSCAWLPAISCVEVALLHERGRSQVGMAELEETLERNENIQILSMDVSQAKEFAALRSVRDPFDRLVIAAARTTGSSLVTADEAIAASGLVQVIWA